MLSYIECSLRNYPNWKPDMLDLSAIWYRNALHPISLCLLPFTFIFGSCSLVRKLCYQLGLFKIHHFDVPVIVVGNITVGGTGKTPFVIWLVNYLQSLGYRPGIVSRGVGGIKHEKPHRVKKNDPVHIVGDEAILFSRHANCPIVIGLNRVAAVRHLLMQSDCNIIVSDDGLQHYRLDRDIEIAMIDGVRRLGNKLLLPAGPLRERPRRLNKVDFIVVNGGDNRDEFTMEVKQQHLVSLMDENNKVAIVDFKDRRVHAIAGIGHPERFFNSLRKAGFDVIPHFFPDHYFYKAQDLDFSDALPIVMTEKDAVKCMSFKTERCWYLPITSQVNSSFEERLLEKLKVL